MITRALRDEAIDIWGDGSVVRDFIFVDDVVDALTAAACDRSPRLQHRQRRRS
jgi:UDP-glucose 4-epimerase